MGCFYAIRPGPDPTVFIITPLEQKVNINNPGTPLTQQIANIDRALCTAYIASKGVVTWLCARSSSFPISGCGFIPSR